MQPGQWGFHIPTFQEIAEPFDGHLMVSISRLKECKLPGFPGFDLFFPIRFHTKSHDSNPHEMPLKVCAWMVIGWFILIYLIFAQYIIDWLMVKWVNWSFLQQFPHAWLSSCRTCPTCPKRWSQRSLPRPRRQAGAAGMSNLLYIYNIYYIYIYVYMCT